MLTATQQFRLGLGIEEAAEKLPDDLPTFLAALAGGEIVDPSNLPAIAGFTSAALDCYPDAAEWKWEQGGVLKAHAEKISQVVKTREGQSPVYNDFFLGRFARLGTMADLRELIRRARHRDGSTASIVLGSATHQMLSAAADELPELDTLLKSNGVNLAALKTGEFPPEGLEPEEPENVGTSTPAAPGTMPLAAAALPAGFGSMPPPPAEPRWIGGRMVGGPVEVTTLAAAAAETVSGVSAGDSEVKPETVALSDNDMGQDPKMGSNAAGKQLAGWNLETGLITMFGLRLTPTAALAALQSLVVAVQNILIPHEGYLWIDEMEAAGSTLVCLDKWLADRVKLPERSGDLALRAGVDTLWLQGSITQSKEEGPQFGHYKAIMQHGAAGSYEEFGDYLDLNDAKFDLARKVRRVLASPAV